MSASSSSQHLLSLPPAPHLPPLPGLVCLRIPPSSPSIFCAPDPSSSLSSLSILPSSRWLVQVGLSYFFLHLHIYLYIFCACNIVKMCVETDIIISHRLWLKLRLLYQEIVQASKHVKKILLKTFESLANHHILLIRSGQSKQNKYIIFMCHKIMKWHTFAQLRNEKQEINLETSTLPCQYGNFKQVNIIKQVELTWCWHY